MRNQLHRVIGCGSILALRYWIRQYTVLRCWMQQYTTPRCQMRQYTAPRCQMRQYTCTALLDAVVYCTALLDAVVNLQTGKVIVRRPVGLRPPRPRALILNLNVATKDKPLSRKSQQNSIYGLVSTQKYLVRLNIRRGTEFSLL